MALFECKVSGLYNDFCEIRKDDLLIFRGGVTWFLDIIDSEWVLRVNYGLEIDYYNIVSRNNCKFIILPKYPECNKDNYKYIPLVFNELQFEEVVNITYKCYDKAMEIKEATNEDIIKMWVYSSGVNDKSYTVLENLRSIVAFSDIELELNIIDKVINSKKLIIRKYRDNCEEITAFFDLNNEIFEWKCFLIENNQILLRLDDEYCIEF